MQKGFQFNRKKFNACATCEKFLNCAWSDIHDAMRAALCRKYDIGEGNPDIAKGWEPISTLPLPYFAN